MNFIQIDMYFYNDTQFSNFTNEILKTRRKCQIQMTYRYAPKRKFLYIMLQRVKAYNSIRCNSCEMTKYSGPPKILLVKLGGLLVFKNSASHNWQTPVQWYLICNMYATNFRIFRDKWCWDSLCETSSGCQSQWESLYSECQCHWWDSHKHG